MALTYQQAVEQTITGAEQFHEIINGSATSEVVVEDGSKIPTVRKALLDNFYYKDPIDWQQGQNELVFNQIRKFTDGTWWIAPTATATNPIVMGVTPYGDPLWKVFSWDRVIDSQKANRKLIERSWAEAGYNVVVGSFQEGATLNTTTDVIINYGSDFGIYSWGGTLPKVVPANSTTTGTGGVSPTAWLSVLNKKLRDELSEEGGAGIIGGLAKPVTWSGFAGGADPTGVLTSDAAFAAAATYEGDVRIEGDFKLSGDINRTKSVMELPPGSSVTPNKIQGGNTALGSNIPTRTIFGRMSIRDSEGAYSATDGFITDPDMGQTLRLDAKSVPGQCVMFISSDRARPIIGPSAYVGLHSKHNQTLAATKTWAINPVITKNVRASDLPVGVDSETIGMEISVANNTNERGQPQGAGMVEGLFVSYVALQNEASTAITTGGLTAGWRSAMWLDGVTPQGTHIFLRDENSGNAGVRCGIDTTGVSAFSDSAMLLGRGHGIASLDTGGAIRPLLYINSANEITHGNTIAHRFIGSISVFDHTIRPGSDNVYDYGSSAFRGRTAYFGTGSINTSDERHKPIIERIPDELLDAWADVDWGNRFKFDDALAEKGDDGARWHFGLIAQWVRDTLDKHGIDGFSLGLLCYDEWGDIFEDVQTNTGEMTKKKKTVKAKKTIKRMEKESKVVKDELGNMVLVEVDVIKEEPVMVMEYVKDENGNFVFQDDGTKMTVFIPVEEDVEVEYDAPADPVYEKRLLTPAGNRYGIRYEEALSLEAALQRRNYERLLSRVEMLEGK